MLFNGVPVGEVTDLGLIADQPNEVLATISIVRDVPVRADTHVGLVFSGLTGTAQVALVGGAPVAVTKETLVSEPGPGGIRTILDRQAVGEQRYFDAAGFAGRTVGLTP